MTSVEEGNDMPDKVLTGVKEYDWRRVADEI